MERGICRLLAAALVLGGVFAGPGPSAAEREKIIASVEIEGNRRISREAVLARIKTRDGSRYLQEDLNADLKRLHEWGPFSSIQVEAKELPGGEVDVLFLVEEKPIVKKIVFEGNREFDDEDLQEKIKTTPGEVLSEARLNEDINAIYKLYEEEGYYQTGISYQEKIDPDSGEAAVFINIREGHEIRVKEITIAGAVNLDESDIRGVMETHAQSLFSILHRGFFKKEEFDADLDRIAVYCRSQGYLDMKILDVEKTVGDGGTGLYITITISEGKQYHAGEVRLAGNENFPVADLEILLPLKTGDVFSYEALRKDTVALRDFYFARGYIDADINPRAVLNQATGRMDITYAIRENQISYISRIDITGNKITRDIVIRRELLVKPGEIFNGIKVKRSQERLQNLGFFQRVSIDPLPTKIPDRKDLMVRLEEKKTGEFMFGVGYSSEDDFIGFVEIGQGNFDLFNPPFFMGDGQKLKIRAEFGSSKSNYEISFVEPWLFGIPLSFGVDLYRRTHSWADYNEKRLGGDIRLRKLLTAFTQLGLTYRLENVDIYDIDDDADWSIQSEEGTNLVSSLTPSISRDTRDSFLIPTRGMNNTLACEVAGGILGGDKEFIKTTFDNSFYLSIFEGHILGFRYRAGTAEPYGNTEIVPVYERFFLGGANTIRGFRYREVGPEGTDPRTGLPNGDPVGGDSMMMGSVEYTFPIIEMVRGAFFCDIGNVWAAKDWEMDETVFGDQWFRNLQSGAGIGLRLYLPIGPIKLDYGWPLHTDGWNDTGGRFHFNIGYAF
ncbi:MAG: outer membrane protein assembly factor BamA [PVC group bacterium]